MTSDCAILSVVPEEAFSMKALDTLRQLASALECPLLVAGDSNAPVHDDELVLVSADETEFAARNRLLDSASEHAYVIFGDLTSVNDRIDIDGVRNALQILKAGLLDVATANQHMFFFDRSNFVKLNVAAPFRSFMPSSAIVPVTSAYGGLAVYRMQTIGSTRFQTADFVGFNSALSRQGGKIAVVPWMVNSGQDEWWLMVATVAFVSLFVIGLIVTNFRGKS
jgi:hypothetical protein